MSDPYVYPGTNILRNRFGIQNQLTLDDFERKFANLSLERLRQKPLTLPIGVVRLKATHKAIFGEVYEWAGEFRTGIGAMKKWREAGYAVVYGPSQFIPQEMDRIFANLAKERNLCGLTVDRFAERAAHFYGEMDGTHPFREGNSRTLRQFFVDLARAAGFALDWSANGVDEAARQRLYTARDQAAMHGKPELLAGMIRAGLAAV